MSTKFTAGPVWILWWGGGNYSVPSVQDAEEVPYADVVSILLERYENSDGSTPCVDESSEAQVFYSDPRESDDPYPDQLVRWSHYHNTFRREAC